MLLVNVEPVIGENVSCVDNSTGGPTSWEWMKDGVVFSTAQNTLLYCPVVGDFYISLRVTNAFGTSTSAPELIHPLATPPVI